MVNTISNPLELLIAPERALLSGSYQHYFAVKRNNFLATITEWNKIWRAYLLLDELWMREFQDLNPQTDPNVALPLALFINAQAQCRIAMELAFTRLLPESFNTLRMAIESVYFASRILRDPRVAKIWGEKAQNTKESRRIFDEEFTKGRKKRFDDLGLGKLYELWAHFSEWSHPNINSLSRRIRFSVPPPKAAVEFQYFETDSRNLALSLFELLVACHQLENVMFLRFSDRLRLDPELQNKRTEFQEFADRTRLELIARFKLKPPAIFRSS